METGKDMNGSTPHTMQADWNLIKLMDPVKKQTNTYINKKYKINNLKIYEFIYVSVKKSIF